MFFMHSIHLPWAKKRLQTVNRLHGLHSSNHREEFAGGGFTDSGHCSFFQHVQPDANQSRRGEHVAVLGLEGILRISMGCLALHRAEERCVR